MMQDSIYIGIPIATWEFLDQFVLTHAYSSQWAALAAMSEPQACALLPPSHSSHAPVFPLS